MVLRGSSVISVGLIQEFEGNARLRSEFIGYPPTAMSKSFKISLVVALLVLMGVLAWRFLFNVSDQTPASPPAQPEETIPSDSAAINSGNANSGNTNSVNAEPFAEAVRTATRAAELTQTAQTPEEWAAVGVEWDNAMQLMMKVSADHERYAIAQDRIPTYQANRDYAFTNAGLLEP